MKLKFTKQSLAIFTTLALFALPFSSYASSTPEEQRAAIHKMESETLARLYKAQPDTQREVQQAVGYAVFSSGSLAVIWVSGGYGHGVAHNNNNGQVTYMQMASAGVGLGVGAKGYNTVFVFHDPKAYHDFITTGVDLTGSADASAKVGSKGKAASGSADVLPGVRIYQLTDTGLLAQLMVQGTKYWRDNSLNGTAAATSSHTNDNTPHYNGD